MKRYNSFLRMKHRAKDSEDEDSETTSDSNSTSSSERDVEGKKPLFKQKYKRCVTKSGACALRKRHRVSDLSYYTTDLFTSLIDSRWRYILLIFTLSFISTWLMFGVLWWVIAFAHGDLKEQRVGYKESEAEPEVSVNGTDPCVTKINDMLSAFLFSMETQYTTGYGTRSPTTQCPEAIFLLCIQSIFGMLHQSVMVGVVFAKLARPKARLHSIRFSKKAVICQRDGTMCLMFRIADVRKSHMIGCKVRAWLIHHRTSKEGETLSNYQKKLKISIDDGGSDMFLLWPITVVHCIDSKSPLYNMSAVKMLNAEFEVIVSLVCTAETTGQTTEARRSYTTSEIIWGHRFQNILIKESNKMFIDYGMFNKTTQVDTPLCCAMKLKCLSSPGSPLTIVSPATPWTSDNEASPKQPEEQ